MKRIARLKSSSELFPVALLGAEQLTLWNEDTYRLKPNNSTDLSVEFVLTRVSRPEQTNARPLLWLPPFLSNRSDWRERWETQIIDLLSHDFELWLLDWRGHGLSPRSQRWAQTTLNDLASFDVPAAVAFVCEQNPNPLMLLVEDSSAQVWLAAHAYEAEASAYLNQLLSTPALLLWPVLGRVGLAQFVSAMHWQDRQLEVSRQGVQFRGGFEVLPRRLFDELLLGRDERAKQWRGHVKPSPFVVLDLPGRERSLVQFLKTVPDERGQALLSTRGHLRAGLLRRWLNEVSTNPACAEATPP